MSLFTIFWQNGSKRLHDQTISGFLAELVDVVINILSRIGVHPNPDATSGTEPESTFLREFYQLVGLNLHNCSQITDASMIKIAASLAKN